MMPVKATSTRSGSSFGPYTAWRKICPAIRVSAVSPDTSWRWRPRYIR